MFYTYYICLPEFAGSGSGSKRAALGGSATLATVDLLILISEYRRDAARMVPGLTVHLADTVLIIPQNYQVPTNNLRVKNSYICW